MSITHRTRARTTQGAFKGDNPLTPDVNEAWEDTTLTAKKQTEKKEAPKKTKVKAALPPPWSALYKAMVLRGEIKE